VRSTLLTAMLHIIASPALEWSCAQPLLRHLPPMLGVFPDNPSPVVRNGDDAEETVFMRWGTPAPPPHRRTTSANIRNGHRRTGAWLAQAGEPVWCRLTASPLQCQIPRPKKQVVVWFALDDSRPPLAFAGIWTTFNGDRGPKCEPVPERNRSTHLATVLGVVLNWRAAQNGQLPESSHLVRSPIARGTSTTGRPTLILPHDWSAKRIGFENKHPITVTSDWVE
jgi:hypothetical protein